MLFRKTRRDIWGNKVQFFAILVIVLLGSMFFAGFSSLADVQDNYIKKYYKEYNLPDVWAYYSGITKKQAEKIEEVDGVKSIYPRHTLSVTVFDKNSQLMMMSYDSDVKIGKLYVEKGRVAKNAKEIVIDVEYAKANKLEIGNKIKVKYNNNKTELKIVGFIESTEYLSKIQDSLADVPNHKAYGIAYFSKESTKKIIGADNPLYNEVLIDIKKSVDVEKIRKEISKKTKKANYLYCISRSLNGSYASFKSEIEQNKNYSYLFPLVFFLIAAAMIFITVNKLTEAQRMQIGIMKALGTRHRKILAHYVISPVIISSIGALLGTVIGSIWIPKVMLNIKAEIYDLPGIKPVVSFDNIIPSVVLMVICAAIAAMLSCKKILKENAASAMRPESPKIKQSLVIEKNEGFWTRLRMDTRIVWRNVFFNKRRVFLSALGIVGSMVVMVIGLGMNDSVNMILETQYRDIYRYDAQVALNYSINEKNGITRLSDIDHLKMPKNTNGLAYTDIGCEISLKGEKEEILYASLVAFEGKMDKYFSILDETRKEIKPQNGSVIISSKLANRYNYKKGDKITFTTIDPNYKSKKIRAKIGAISMQYLTQDIYCTETFMKNHDLNPNPLKMLVNYNHQKTTFKQFEEKMLDNPEVSTVKSIKEIEKSMVQSTEAMKGMILIMFIGSLIISLVVVSNISSINFMERKRTLATMKVLGCNRRRMYGLFLKENLLITLLGGILGIPAGAGILKIILDGSETTTTSFPYPSIFLNVIISFICLLIFTVIANITIYRRIKKLDMVESLKSIE